MTSRFLTLSFQSPLAAWWSRSVWVEIVGPFFDACAGSSMATYTHFLLQNFQIQGPGPCEVHIIRVSTLYTTFRVLYSPLYQAAMQAYLLSTIEEKSWAQMNKNTLFLV